MNLNQSEKVFLREFFWEEIKPLFEEYWIKVFELRKREDKFLLNSPLVDLFKVIQSNKEMKCVIPLPDCRPFWECVLAFYLLWREDLYESPARLADMILKTLPTILQPENLSKDILAFLFRLANHLDDLHFFQNPIEFVPSIKVLFLMSANYPKSENELPHFNEQVEKWTNQAVEEEGKRLENFEKKWREIQREKETTD